MRRPGLVTIGWMPCHCVPAEEAAERGRGLGHRYAVCRVCEGRGVTKWIFDPPHEDGQ